MLEPVVYAVWIEGPLRVDLRQSRVAGRRSAAIGQERTSVNGRFRLGYPLPQQRPPARVCPGSHVENCEALTPSDIYHRSWAESQRAASDFTQSFCQ